MASGRNVPRFDFGDGRCLMAEKVFFHRLVVLRLLAVALFLILLASLWDKQIYKGGHYRSLADGNRTRELVIAAPRGIIFDRNGVILARNKATGRSYPYGLAMAHLLDGVERQYEQILAGRDGKELVEVDALGKKLRTISTLAPTAGENLNLTIDGALQRIAFDQIKDKKGAVVATDPNTGAVLALVSSPSFNPEKVADFLTAPEEPLFNRAISGTYPSGSTFKIVTAVAGLETGKIDENFQVDDPGILVIGSYKFPNWKFLRDGGLQGTLNVVGALQKSNDIFFYKTGEMTGFENLSVWAKKIGLGRTLGVDLPGEAAGNWPDKIPFLGDLYHLAIGQGDLLVTPLQVNAWTSVIANGGKLCVPHVVNKDNQNCTDLKISKKNLELVKEGMVAACKPGGTAWPLFGLEGVACKTGTAEYGNENKTHAWLTAFTKDISITVLVEGGGEGSDVAAPIVKKILEKYFGS